MIAPHVRGLALLTPVHPRDRERQSTGQERCMSTDYPSSVSLQTSTEPIASVPEWFGEVALIAHTMTRLGFLSEISEHVRFARKRFGRFEVIDFVVMLIGYAISGEPTLKAYYERLQPFATAFMALFGRHQLPHRATLSRFLAALDEPFVEALRSVFLHDALTRLGSEANVGGLWDRQATRWTVFDLDGTRQAARQRALPQGPDLPSPQRRLSAVCAPGYTGRKRGEVVRTRTTLRAAPIPISGSSPVEQRAMVITEESCY